MGCDRSFKPYNGFVGAIAGLLVAVKQLIPEQEYVGTASPRDA